MPWDQFTAVWPVVTLVVGYVGSQYSERRKERHERERIVLQRAADVEGEALLELQDLLPELLVQWPDLLNKLRKHEDQGGHLDPDDVYEHAVKASRPWQRAKLLSSRIRDDTLRDSVQTTTDLIYPFNHRDVSRMLAGMSHPYETYPYDDAQHAVADTIEQIGRQLRQSAAAAAGRRN